MVTVTTPVPVAVPSLTVWPKPKDAVPVKPDWGVKVTARPSGSLPEMARASGSRSVRREARKRHLEVSGGSRGRPPSRREHQQIQGARLPHPGAATRPARPYLGFVRTGGGTLQAPKTRPTKASVSRFLSALEPAARREDAQAVARLMREVTGARPVLWGTSIVGFGSRPITYASGEALDWPVLAFSPRAAALTLYVRRAFPGREALVRRLGKVKVSGGCLHVKRLAEVDLEALRAILAASAAAAVEPAQRTARRASQPSPRSTRPRKATAG